MTAPWMDSLITETPEAGFALAVKLSRMAVKMTQPDDATRQALRPAYETDAAQLIAISGVVAANFRTVAEANDYWRSTGLPLS